jgi:hypothetical protein
MFINGITHRWRHMPKEAAAVAVETDTHPRAGGKKCLAPPMHNIADWENFNAPLGGTNLHFSKPLQSGFIRFRAPAQGFIP